MSQTTLTLPYVFTVTIWSSLHFWTDLFGVGQLGWNTSSSSVSMLSILHSGTRHFLSPSCDRRRFQLLLRLPELRDRRRQGERQGEGRGDILGERRGESRGDARILELVCKEKTSIIFPYLTQHRVRKAVLTFILIVFVDFKYFLYNMFFGVI